MESISPASLATTRADVTPFSRSRSVSLSSAKTSLGTARSTPASSMLPRDVPCEAGFPCGKGSASEERRRSGSRQRVIDHYPFASHGLTSLAVDQDTHTRCLRELSGGVYDLPQPPQHAGAAAPRLDLTPEIHHQHPVSDTQPSQARAPRDRGHQPRPALRASRAGTPLPPPPRPHRRP